MVHPWLFAPMVPLYGLVRVAVATASVGAGDLVQAVGLQAGSTAASHLVVQDCVVRSCSPGLARATDGRVHASGRAWRQGGAPA